MRTDLKKSDDRYVIDLIRQLFLGQLDGVKTHRYKTQAGIASAIQAAMKKKHPERDCRTSQSQVSKVYRKYLQGQEFEYEGQTYLIDKTDGYYQLITSADLREKSISRLEKLSPFAKGDFFYNNTIGPSTIFALKIIPDYAKATEQLFKGILGSSCFDVSITEYEDADYSLAIIFLNPSSKDFNSQEKWLKGYLNKIKV